MNVRKLAQALIFLLLALPATGFAQSIRIDSIVTTESRCESSGTLRVYASSGSGNSGNYRYQIAGPAGYIRPLQTGSTFTAMSPNTYQVVVSDIVDNTTDTASATVTGGYTIMNPSVVFTNGDCVLEGATATITANGGRPPYTYQIVSPVNTPVQSGNVFTHLSYNTAYTLRVYDSCGNFQSRTITPTTTDNGVYTVAPGCLRWVACDSFYMTYSVQSTAPNTHKYPYTLTFSKPDGSLVTHTIASGPASGTLRDTFYFSGISGDFFGLSVSNGCSNVNNDYASTSLATYLDMVARPTAQCDGTYAYRFDTYDNSSTSSCTRPRPAMVTYTLINPSGAVVATQVNNASFGSQPSGNGYRIVRTSACGGDTLYFNWAGSPQALAITATAVTRNVCKERMVGASLTVSNAIGNVRVVFASGPASVTLLDGSTHSYTYPDTITNYSNGQIINYLGAGTYKILAIDGCGRIDSTMLNVNASIVRHSTATFSSNAGCPFSNRITWNVTSNTSAGTGVVAITPGGYSSVVSGANGSGSYTSIPDGVYYCSFTYASESSGKYLKNMAALNCDVIRDTITIKPYVNPIFYGPSVTNCSGTQNDVILFPDMTKGSQPFTYQITAGPVTRPAQGLPVFLNLPEGTYTFLMTDACGNSYQSQKQISSLNGIAFETIGNTCLNGTARFAAPPSDYVTYHWTRPNGTTYTGDTLTINSVSAADTGLYHIMMVVDINGCVDTNYFDQHLEGFCGNIVLPVTGLELSALAEGGSARLLWATLTEKNNRGFAIERSADGKHFVQIGFTNSKASLGNSGVKLGYSYMDVKPLVGKNFYRLKQVDRDGAAVYSNIVSASFGNITEGRLYPNPARDRVMVTASPGSTISVYNIMGQQVAVKVAMDGAQVVLDTAHLPAGNYTVQVRAASGTYHYKLTIAR